MSDTDIQVILNELEHLREEMVEIKEDLKGKCTSCLNAGLAEQAIANLDKVTTSDSRKLWYNINALWTVIGAAAAGLTGAALSHLVGK